MAGQNSTPLHTYHKQTSDSMLTSYMLLHTGAAAQSGSRRGQAGCGPPGGPHQPAGFGTLRGVHFGVAVDNNMPLVSVQLGVYRVPWLPICCHSNLQCLTLLNFLLITDMPAPFCLQQSLSDASDDTNADASDMAVQANEDWPHASFDWDSAQVRFTR